MLIISTVQILDETGAKRKIRTGCNPTESNEVIIRVFWRQTDPRDRCKRQRCGVRDNIEADMAIDSESKHQLFLRLLCDELLCHYY